MRYTAISSPEPATAGVQVYALGSFRVLVGGAPLAFDQRGQPKPMELLKALIALGGENVPEQRLSDALWPDADGDAAHQNFASTLHRLRALVGSETLTLRNRALSLQRGQCWVDALAFAQEARKLSAALTADDPDGAGQIASRALALYAGPFLDGEFEPPEIASARERLHAAFLRVVRDMAAYWCRQGAPRQAIELYRRGLEADEVAEEFHQGLMRCCLATGRIAEGIAAYRRCREVMGATVNVQPSAETERIHQALRAAQATAGEASVSAAALAGSGTPAFAGGASALGAAGASRRRWLLLAAGVVLLAAVATGVWQAYRSWASQRAVAELKRTAALSFPGKPSIAVLALANLTGDPKKDYLSDGITETVLTHLARNGALFVVARSSSFAYKGTPVDVRAVGRELGVRYVLEGSLQEATDRLRIAAQLIDASDGHHVWSQLYDRPMADLFAVQDDIALNIANQLNVTLVRGEWARSDLHATRNLEAYDLFLRAQNLALTYEKEPTLRAAELLKQALALDPGYARAMGLLGWQYLLAVRYNWAPDSAGALQEAEALANRALAIEPDVNAYTLLARLRTRRGQYDEAIAVGRKALELEPNNAWAHSVQAWSYVLADRAEEAIPHVRRAVRLAPHTPLVFQFVEAKAYYLAGRYQWAVEAYKRVLANPAPSRNLKRFARLDLICVYVILGRLDEARQEAAPYRTDPDYAVHRYVEEKEHHGHKNLAWLRRAAKLLREAGLPE